MSEAQEKYAKWHACKARRHGKEKRALAVVAPESPNFAVASRSDGLATAAPAPAPGWDAEYTEDGFVLRYVPRGDAAGEAVGGLARSRDDDGRLACRASALGKLDGED